jgi:hypothetical protein
MLHVIHKRSPWFDMPSERLNNALRCAETSACAGTRFAAPDELALFSALIGASKPAAYSARETLGDCRCWLADAAGD